MEEIASKILENIEKTFQREMEESVSISNIYEKIKAGTATYEQANEYAVEVGEILAKAYKENISSSILPDGKMYYEVAEQILNPTLDNNYNLITKVSMRVQQSLNQSAHIGIKAIQPKLNQDRIDGIINKVSSYDSYDDAAWVLNEPVKTFSQSIVDDTIRENAEFHSKSGMRPKIVRKIAGNCCEWCSNLAGSYTYPDGVPSNVYRRHQRCRCTVEYNPGDGKVQNVHSKQWKEVSESGKIDARKNLQAKRKASETPTEKVKRIEQERGLGLADRIASHPKMLQAYTPKGLKEALENVGYDVKPLNRGKYKGISFEDGGGFKVNYGGDKLLQYHPEGGSHHGGAYYKISSGEGGTLRYGLDGTEKKDVQ